MSKMVDDISNYIGKRFSEINHGLVLFPDRFDNALETAHDEIWTPIQVGLLEAAWDVMRINHHIKIYLSIRQEACAALINRGMIPMQRLHRNFPAATIRRICIRFWMIWQNWSLSMMRSSGPPYIKETGQHCHFSWKAYYFQIEK